MGEQGRRLEEIAIRLRDARTGPRGGVPSPWLASLQGWQAWRLGVTFADLLADPDSEPAARFFLEDMYGADDVGWRDRDVLRMMPTMRRWLPDAVLGTVACALELDWLSYTLDGAVARELAAMRVDRARPLAVADYAMAYRRVGRAEDRERQIDLMVGVGRDLDRIVRMPLVYAVLRMSRGAAGAAGLRQLQSFLERGFAAFRRLGGAGDFLRTIESRERAAMKKLLAGDAQPFGRDVPKTAPRAF